MPAPNSSEDTIVCLATNTPSPRVLADLLWSVGPERAAELRPGDPTTTLDSEAVLSLLGHPAGFSADLLLHPWMPICASLCGDPSVLTSLAATVLADHDQLGWLNQPDVAARLVDNPALSAATRYVLMALTNPRVAPRDWEEQLRELPPTAEVVQVMTQVSRGRPEIMGRLPRVMLQSPALGANTALAVLAELGKQCDRPESSAALRVLVQREDLVALLARLEPGCEPEPGETDARLVASLKQVVRMQWEHHPHGCGLSPWLSGILYRVVDDPGTASQGGVYPVLRTMVNAVSVLGSCPHLPAEAYQDLANSALAEQDHGSLRALAANTGCPKEALGSVPVRLVGNRVVAKLAGERFGDNTSYYLTLAGLLERENLRELQVAALLELAIQTTG